jgi:hypothetical protein
MSDLSARAIDQVTALLENPQLNGIRKSLSFIRDI